MWGEYAFGIIELSFAFVWDSCVVLMFLSFPYFFIVYGKMIIIIKN